MHTPRQQRPMSTKHQWLAGCPRQLSISLLLATIDMLAFLIPLGIVPVAPAGRVDIRALDHQRTFRKDSATIFLMCVEAAWLLPPVGTMDEFAVPFASRNRRSVVIPIARPTASVGEGRLTVERASRITAFVAHEYSNLISYLSFNNHTNGLPPISSGATSECLAPTPRYPRSTPLPLT